MAFNQTSMRPTIRISHKSVIIALVICFILFTSQAHAQDPVVYVTPPITNTSSAEAYSCATEIGRAETYYQIPRGLLYSVAVTESGKFGFPWPWTLNVDGQAIYADSYANAAQFLYDEKGNVRQNMAVGCMQIYMRYHSTKFETPMDALNPKNNVWYAASFLRDLRIQHGNWTHAVAHYHANSDKAQQKYVCKVLRIFRQINELSPSQDDGGYCTQPTA